LVVVVVVVVVIDQDTLARHNLPSAQPGTPQG